MHVATVIVACHNFEKQHGFTYRIREFFTSWLPVEFVVLNPKIFSWTTGIVAGGENDSSIRRSTLSRSNSSRNSWRRHDTRTGNPNILNSVSSKDTANLLNSLIVIVSTISSNDQCLWYFATIVFCGSVEKTLDEIFDIVFFFDFIIDSLPNFDLFSKTRCSWFHSCNWSGFHFSNRSGHREMPLLVTSSWYGT